MFFLTPCPIAYAHEQDRVTAVAAVLLCRRQRERTPVQTTNINIIASSAENNVTAGHVNPSNSDGVGNRRAEQRSTAGEVERAYDQIYTRLAPTSGDNIGLRNMPEPPTDTMYLELFDDDGERGNPPEVPPPREDNNNAKQSPADSADNECSQTRL